MALLGFAPSVHRGPANTQSSTTVVISAGSISGVLYGLSKISVGATVGTYYVFVDNSGNMTVSTNPTGGVNLICTVVLGNVVTSGTEVTATGALSPLIPGAIPPPPSTNLTTNVGITSVVDNRNWS
jgi:hypothetical protein